MNKEIETFRGHFDINFTDGFHKVATYDRHLYAEKMYNVSAPMRSVSCYLA